MEKNIEKILDLFCKFKTVPSYCGMLGGQCQVVTDNLEYDEIKKVMALCDDLRLTVNISTYRYNVELLFDLK